MKYFVLSLIKLYQKTVAKTWGKLNPHYGCRFYPSCSEYCCQAINKHGIVKGLFKGLRRIVKCNPFNEGGVDLC